MFMAEKAAPDTIVEPRTVTDLRWCAQEDQFCAECLRMRTVRDPVNSICTTLRWQRTRTPKLAQAEYSRPWRET